MGFLFNYKDNKNSYIRNPWNIIDCLVVAFSLSYLAVDSSALKSLKAIRALRAFRPLRVISRNDALKVKICFVINRS